MYKKYINTISSQLPSAPILPTPPAYNHPLTRIALSPARLSSPSIRQLSKAYVKHLPRSRIYTSSHRHQTLQQRKNVSKLNRFAEEGNRSSSAVDSASPGFQHLFWGRLVSAFLRKGMVAPNPPVLAVSLFPDFTACSPQQDSSESLKDSSDVGSLSGWCPVQQDWEVQFPSLETSLSSPAAEVNKLPFVTFDKGSTSLIERYDPLENGRDGRMLTFGVHQPESETPRVGTGYKRITMQHCHARGPFRRNFTSAVKTSNFDRGISPYGSCI